MPAEAGADLVEDGDGSFRVGDGVVVVFGGVAVVGSALEAAVTILRVYCSWPGESATMNDRAEVEKYR